MNDRIRDPNSMVWMSAFGRLLPDAVNSRNRPNPASGERQVSGTPSGIRGRLTRGLLAIVGAETVFARKLRRLANVVVLSVDFQSTLTSIRR